MRLLPIWFKLYNKNEALVIFSATNSEPIFKMKSAHNNQYFGKSVTMGKIKNNIRDIEKEKRFSQFPTSIIIRPKFRLKIKIGL